MFVSREMIGTGADGKPCRRGGDAAARRGRPTRSGSGEQIQDARLEHLLLGEAGSAAPHKHEQAEERADDRKRRAAVPDAARRRHPCAAKAVVIIELTSAFDGTLPLITSLPSMAKAGVDMTP